jgi:hypothetical protein
MKVAERIEGVVQQALPEVICDDCIAGLLHKDRHHINQETRLLAGRGGSYLRRKGCCSFCDTGNEKFVLVPANVISFPRA